MDWCLNVSDTSLSCILSQCRSLGSLNIGCSEDITNMGFREIGNAGFESRLKFLKVNNCPQITVNGISMVLDSCKCLQYLDVTKTSCYQTGLQFPDCCKVNFAGNASDIDAVVGLLL